MTAACPSGAVLKLAPLKGLARAAAKARNEYAKNTAPATSWLFDVVRGSVMCATEDEIVGLYAALDKDPRVDIVRTKNRFNPPCFNGYRDILMRKNYPMKSVKARKPKDEARKENNEKPPLENDEKPPLQNDEKPQIKFAVGKPSKPPPPAAP